MAFELPDLPYDYSALEPHIDTLTMQIHHDKHHAAYVNGLNKTLEGQDELLATPVEKLLADIETVEEDIRQKVINFAGGHTNHSFFWKIMGPQKGGEPKGEIAEAINSVFGNFDGFKEKFTEKAMGVFGSGWAFLVMDEGGKLNLKRHSFQNSPLMHGNTPLLGIDVWEHAYYLKYQNKRDEYLTAWWNVVNWEAINENFLKAKK
jgi:Fe-Mn family superoxide dismutase